MTFLARTGLDRFNPAESGLRRMRVIATGLLVAMAGLYLIARILERGEPGWGYLRAFAEAAMVGGMADWFAVTALFRHPLGLPVPHTAIVPRNKDRIGDSLALFLRDNFLTASVVARRMRRFDLAGALGRVLADPPATGRLRAAAAGLGRAVLGALDQGRLGGAIKGGIVARLRATRLAPLLGQAIDAAIAEDRHAPMLDAAIGWFGRTLTANEALIRGIVSERAGSMMRWTGLDEKLANAILDGLRRLLVDMAADPAHPARLRATEALIEFAHRLQRDPELQAKVEAWKDEIIANRAVARWIDGLWEQARAGLLRTLDDPQAARSGRFGEALRSLGTTLSAEPALQRRINLFARRAVVGAVARYGDGIVRLVSDTVRGWDTQTVTARLEAAVGRDLQYIRVNGTIVGGLVGLAIHLVDRLA